MIGRAVELQHVVDRVTGSAACGVGGTLKCACIYIERPDGAIGT